MGDRGGSFFGRRKGKTLRPLQRRALERLLPALRLDLSVPPTALADLFPHAVTAVWLEIGFGGGEHLLHRAQAAPEMGFIGVEPFENGLAKAIVAIDRAGLRNVRLFDQDAVLLLDWLPPQSLAGLDLLFPDPWPKPRHWKRRFVNRQNLDRIARCLAPEGVFRFASDVDDYLRWTLREIAVHDRLQWTETSLDTCRRPWAGWHGTRYEAKAIAEGRRPAFLTFRRSAEC